MPYNNVAGVDDTHAFPPEVRAKLAQADELKATTLTLVNTAVAALTPALALDTDGVYYLALPASLAVDTDGTPFFQPATTAVARVAFDTDGTLYPVLIGA